MQLQNIRGGNRQELQDRQYQIGVGISLGNKWFSVENITELIKWSLQYTKDKVIVYVADSIHAINLEVRKDISKEKAEILADEMGTKILKEVEEKLREILSYDDFNKIIFVKWRELVDIKYYKKVSYLAEKYIQDNNFRNSIENIVKSFTSKEVRRFREQEIHRLGDYIIQELPECLCRVQMAGYDCDAYTYPFDGELPEFIEKIQNGKIFPEIKENIIDTKLKVFLAVR